MTSHMKKKKAKRYQEGGEAEDKKRGLGASKDDKVGFFERLRMGNIDDPKSEAYKRFGAGRGQAETTKEKEAIKSYKGSANPFQGDDIDPFSAVRKPSGEIMREPAKEPVKTPAKAKPAVVTKEQLKASGFDNLRDYLNAQRGLTRRGGAAATKSTADKTAAPRGSFGGTQDDGDAGEEAARKALADSRAKERAKRDETTDPGLTQSQAAAQRTAEVKRDSAKTGSQRLGEKADRAGNIYARGQTPRQSDTEKQAAARKKLGTVPPRPPRGFSSPASRKAWDDKYGDQYEPSGRKKSGATSNQTQMGDSPQTGLTAKDREEFKRLSDAAISEEGGRGTMKRGGAIKMNKGGSVAPSKKVLAKSGFYDSGKTKSERQSIVSKVTTKPQRVKMVEKMLSASRRGDGIAIRGKTRGRMM